MDPQHSVKSSVPASEVPTVSKWSVRSIRSGPMGDVVWMLGIMSITGDVLKEFKITKELGETLDSLQPASVITKIFGCGTQKNLRKA